MRHLIDSRITKLQSANTTKYACLYNYLPGCSIPWEAYTKEHIKQLGGMMAQMHASFSNMPKKNLPSVADEYIQIFKRLIRYFNNPQVTQAINQNSH